VQSKTRVSIEGVGELEHAGPCWRLVYSRCTHTQLLAREGIEDPAAAAGYVEREFRQCLICRAPSNRPPTNRPG
jgi:hypothetical protein